MRTRLAIVAAVGLLALAALCWFGLRKDTVAPRVEVPRLAAAIGEGDDAIGVTADGKIVRWLPLPEDPPLPRLPLDEPPKRGSLGGTALEQVQVLAAVPKALRPFVASSSYGESGVSVELTTGIELRFGDAGRADRKWRAAAAILADPSITALDYVDLHAPSKPGIGGSETATLPEP